MAARTNNRLAVTGATTSSGSAPFSEAIRSTAGHTGKNAKSW